MKFPILLPSQKEIAHGWRYLAFETVFLGYFLTLCAYFFNLPLGSTELNLICFFLNFAVAVVIFRRFLLRTIQVAGKRILPILLTAVGGFFVYYGLTTVISIVIVSIEPGFYNVNNANLSLINRQYSVLTALCTIFLVPVAEELLHRGAIFGGLYKRNRIAAYLMSTAVFALIHITGYIGYYEPRTLLLCYLQYIPAGLCLAASYDLTGCIATPILLHAIVNAVGIFSMR